MTNPNLRHDYNFGDPLVWPTEIKGPAYYNERTPADYAPRDPRVWLRQCLHRDCSAERCVDMRPDDGEQRDGVYMGRPFGG